MQNTKCPLHECSKKCSTVSVLRLQNLHVGLLIFFIVYNSLFVGVNLIMILYCKSLILLFTGANAGTMNILSHSLSVIVPWIDSCFIKATNYVAGVIVTDLLAKMKIKKHSISMCRTLQVWHIFSFELVANI